MKRFNKKSLALLLAAVLGFSLVACNNTDDPDTTDDSGEDTENVDDSGDEEEVLEFTLMSSIWGDHEKSLNEDESNIVLDKIQENTNTKVNFEWYPADQYDNRITTTLSSGDIPEVINGGGDKLIEEGAAVPLDDLLEEYGQNILASYEGNPIEENKLKSSKDGKTYMIPFVLDYPPAYSWSIRADWLENVGIDEMPETWDDWLEVWDAFKNDDPNQDGNNTNDIPYSGDIYSLMPIFGMNVSNKFGMMIDEDNNWTLAEESPYFKTFLEEVRMMYDKGYLDQEFTQRGNYVDVNALQTAIMSGIAGSTFTWAAATETSTLALQEVDENARLVGIEPPTGPDGFSGIPARNSVSPTSVITIAAEKRDIVDDLVKFFDYVFSDEGTRIMSYGVEGETYELVDGEPVLHDDVAENFNNARQAGLNFTPLAHNFDPEAYETIMLSGKTYEESDTATQYFYDALYKAEDDWFYGAPILNTEAFVDKGTEVFGQLATALANCVIDEISIDEFYAQYENLKDAGLQDIIDQGNEVWQELNSLN